MAYTVLARKYRSRSFDEVIGQAPIATTLANAIKAGRIHHGYLFTGTRGVGKTSMARILAKSLNCLRSDGPTTQPCNECEACVAIGEGQDIDVIEIDAASNTGVDNIRELRSNTAYRPARSRFKVYIIDEVHMLSTGAFNALLKTLEEPPAHVKFILATTEIQKVPATIQSRCQKFTFRNISPDDIAARLRQICEREGTQADEAVVRRVARLANGSMRDALSILDQLISISPERLSPDLLDEVLPPAHSEQVIELLRHAAASDAAAALAATEAALAGGRGLEVFCNDAIEVVRTLMLVRACGPDSQIVDFPAGNRDELVQLAAQFELSHYVQMIAMLEELRRNVRFSAAGRALVDAVIVRIAKMREWSSIEDLLAGRATPAAGSGAAAPAADRAGDVKKNAPLAAREGHVAQPPSAVPARPPSAEPPRASHPVAPAGSAHRASAWGTDANTDSSPPNYDVPEAHSASGADEYTGDPPDPAPAPDPRQPRTRPLSSHERARLENDPLVREALSLFDGVIVEAVQEVTPGGAR